MHNNKISKLNRCDFILHRAGWLMAAILKSNSQLNIYDFISVNFLLANIFIDKINSS